MRKLTIQLDLSDEDAAPFQGREVIVVIPATVAEYQGFLDHGSRIETGLATCAEAMAAMLDPDHGGDKAEGLRRIASVIDKMRGSQSAMGDFFALHAATQVTVRVGGEERPGKPEDMRRMTQERAAEGLRDHLGLPSKGRVN